MATIVRGTLYTKYFLNAVLVDSVSSSNTHSYDGSNTAKLGCTRKSDRFFQGKIDEVKIFDCALNINDLTVLYYTSIKEKNELSETFKVYPNPTNDYVEVESSQNADIEIINLQGKIIGKHVLSNNKVVIDLSTIPSGVYIIKAKTNNGIVTKKLIKQ